MQVTVYNTRQNENDQTIFFTLIDDEGVSYNWHADIPKEVDPQTWAEANIEMLMCGIYRKMHPDAPNLENLKEWQEWIINSPEAKGIPFKDTWS